MSHRPCRRRGGEADEREGEQSKGTVKSLPKASSAVPATPAVKADVTAAEAKDSIVRIAEMVPPQGSARSSALPDSGLFEKHGGDCGDMEGRDGMGRRCRWRQRRRRLGHGEHGASGRRRRCASSVVIRHWPHGLFWAVHLCHLFFLDVHQHHLIFFWWVAYVGLVGPNTTYILTEN